MAESRGIERQGLAEVALLQRDCANDRAVGPGSRAFAEQRRKVAHRDKIFETTAAKLVNVHIHQFQPGGAVVDAAALAQFQEQWATYRKLVESDCLAHREVSARPDKAIE